MLEKALRPAYKKIVTVAALSICAGILLTGSKMKDELGMVYENISYYELDRLWEGPFVRLVLMIAAFVISWAILFYIPREKTAVSFIGQRTMPIYMLHRILRDVLMFAGIYDYLGKLGMVCTVCAHLPEYQCHLSACEPARGRFREPGAEVAYERV